MRFLRSSIVFEWAKHEESAMIIEIKSPLIVFINLVSRNDQNDMKNSTIGGFSICRE